MGFKPQTMVFDGDFTEIMLGFYQPLYHCYIYMLCINHILSYPKILLSSGG